MSVAMLRLALGLFFLAAGTVILFRSLFAPGLNARFDPLRLDLGGVLAWVLAGLNLARWYAAWSYRRFRATPVRTPLQPDPSLVRPEPPNPELDFTRPGPNGSAHRTEEG